MRNNNPSILTLAALFLIIFAAGKGWLGSDSAIMPISDVNPSANVPINLPTVALPNQTLDLTPLELPPNGAVHYYVTSEPIAPFSISTEAGQNYYAKLVDVNTEQPVVTIFVRGGQPVSITVPLGNYEFRYASGTQWYGEDQLFGPGTTCQKAAKRFDFYLDGNRIIGHTVQLIKQVDGNLPTTPIARSSF